MRNYPHFYIDGRWVDPVEAGTLDVIDPATERVAGRISIGSAADVDRAVAAASAAAEVWGASPRKERLGALERILAEFEKRVGDLATAITEEMGAPTWLAERMQAPMGVGHFKTAIATLEEFSFTEDRGTTRIVMEPIGVCGLITPWNWPVHQICAKVAPAVATGCTVVLKPSEIAPFSGQIFAEIIHAADLPAGVFNLVQGEGPVVGAAMAAHPDIAMISITGSTRAGIEVARTAAATVKRVHQELGGKSPNIILDDADLQQAVSNSVGLVMQNSGQSCRAPTRMLVPNRLMGEASRIARETAESWPPGDPKAGSRMGPVISAPQWDKVQRLIKSGIEQGATLVTGGPGKPGGLEQGYFVRPTVFCDVSNDMEIAREEIFGPVLCMIGYEDEDEAIAIGNDTDYGLGGFVHSRDLDRARRVAARIKAGYVSLNDAGLDLNAPFGGYKQSGNGREFGSHAFMEYLEVKSVLGYSTAR